MKTRKILSSLLALVLIAALLTSSAFAATWYLEDGDITVSADENGQTVKQGDNDAVEDNDVTITQRDSSTATDSTITISTTGDAEAEITIKDINVSGIYDKPSIDVGDSTATINVEGQNTVKADYSDMPFGEKRDPALVRVSGGDLTITSENGGKLELENQYCDGAVLGSNKGEDLSGNIHITGNVDLIAGTDKHTGCGAGIGSGQEGEMSGTVTIDGNARVEATAQADGAGIGSGMSGEMSGTIIIGGNANVAAESTEDGAGIGSGQDGEMSGTIVIDGNAKVEAESRDEDGAGIGSGWRGEMSGSIIIGGNANVAAESDEGGAGIGSGKDAQMSGTILIKDEAIIISHSSEGAAIGSGTRDGMAGQILILGQAKIITGTTGINGKIKPYPHDIIGDGSSIRHDGEKGVYVFGDGITINGISGSSIEALKNNVNMCLDENGNVTNLAVLTISLNEDGTYSAEVTGGAGDVEKLLYNGSETLPTAPGSYPVTVVLKLSGETVKIEIGTIIVPEQEAEPEPEPEPETEPEPEAETGVYAPLYRVTDMDGKDISYEKELVDGVLTLTVKADNAKLVLRSGAPDTLRAQGIEKIVFVTSSARSAFATAEAAALGRGEFVLTHSGTGVSAALAGKALDTAALLIKE